MSKLLSNRSEQALCGVHPELINVVRRAFILSSTDFIVIEGLRSQARQRELMQAGASRTFNSRHLTGHAVDLAPWVNGTIPWQDWHAFSSVASAMKSAARELNVSLVWGGDWKSFRDGPHFELSREVYP
ncbi:M15 family peptidase [Salmonella enterica subsp. enterica]|nr:M15 family peptidase [Salmonella enterica subsp. enterica]EDT7315911.1 M15 family metallopeptidase [Salmonella enterica subsp. enterica]